MWTIIRYNDKNRVNLLAQHALIRKVTNRAIQTALDMLVTTDAWPETGIPREDYRREVLLNACRALLPTDERIADIMDEIEDVDSKFEMAISNLVSVCLIA